MAQVVGILDGLRFAAECLVEKYRVTFGGGAARRQSKTPFTFLSSLLPVLPLPLPPLVLVSSLSL